MKRPTLLLTGASGFAGRYLLRGLESQYNITTLGRRAGSGVVCDLAKEVPQLPAEPFGFVIHAAGAAHRADAEFMRVNVGGTRRLLAALDAAPRPPKALVFISSVAVYGLTEGFDVDEKYPVNPTTDYGESKARAEELLADWCAACGTALTILRPPLIAALDAPGNLGRMIDAMRRGRYATFGSRAGARKSVLAASDLPRLAALALDGGGGTYNVCADYAPGFHEIEAAVQQALGVRRPLRLPLWPLRALAKVYAPARKMISPLTFSNAPARQAFHWEPLSWNFNLQTKKGL